MTDETQNMIAESAKRLFAKSVDRKLLGDVEAGQWPEALWSEVEESGFTRVLVPEDAGGMSGRWSDAYPLLHAIGYYRVPLPLSETIVAACLLARAGLEIPEGPLTVIQQDAGLTLALDGNRLRLEGCVESVPWARNARAVVVAGEVGGQPVLAVVDRKAQDIAITAHAGVLREPRDIVRFANRHAAAFSHHALPVDAVLLCGALARAIMIVGAAESALDQAVQYANERIQFGRPIGKFQAVQQSLAVLAGEVTAAKTAALAAVEAAAQTDEFPSRFAVTVAKTRAGQAAGQCAAISHAVHGAIGFTDEHTLHYATRRLWSWRAEFGADRHWALALGRRLVQRGGQNFWAGLTARNSI